MLWGIWPQEKEMKDDVGAPILITQPFQSRSFSGWEQKQKPEEFKTSEMWIQGKFSVAEMWRTQGQGPESISQNWKWSLFISQQNNRNLNTKEISSANNQKMLVAKLSLVKMEMHLANTLISTLWSPVNTENSLAVPDF